MAPGTVQCQKGYVTLVTLGTEPRRQDLAFSLPLERATPILRQGYGMAGVKIGKTWLPRGRSLAELSIGVTPPPVRLRTAF
jgi:hypothetical protein